MSKPHIVSVVSEVGWSGEARLLLVCTCTWRRNLGSTADFEHVAWDVNHHITDVIRRHNAHPNTHPDAHPDELDDELEAQ